MYWEWRTTTSSLIYNGSNTIEEELKRKKDATNEAYFQSKVCLDLVAGILLYYSWENMLHEGSSIHIYFVIVLAGLKDNLGGLYVSDNKLQIANSAQKTYREFSD